MELPGRWKDLETILNRSSNLAGPDFEPEEHLLDFLQVGAWHAPQPPSFRCVAVHDADPSMSCSMHVVPSCDALQSLSCNVQDYAWLLRQQSGLRGSCTRNIGAILSQSNRSGLCCAVRTLACILASLSVRMVCKLIRHVALFGHHPPALSSCRHQQ